MPELFHGSLFFATVAHRHIGSLGLLVAAIGLWFSRGLLGAARLLCGLGRLGWLACAFWFRLIGHRLAGVLAIDCVVAHSISP
jgi:hypothetical protein